MSSDLASSPNDGANHPGAATYRSRGGGRGGRGRTGQPFRLCGSGGGGLAEDMRGAESGLLALQGVRDGGADTGSESDDEGQSAADDDSSSVHNRHEANISETDSE